MGRKNCRMSLELNPPEGFVVPPAQEARFFILKARRSRATGGSLFPKYVQQFEKQTKWGGSDSGIGERHPDLALSRTGTRTRRQNQQFNASARPHLAVVTSS